MHHSRTKNKTKYNLTPPPEIDHLAEPEHERGLVIHSFFYSRLDQEVIK